MREREAKLAVCRSLRIADVDDLSDDVASTESDVIDQRAVYFDTDDLRLTRSGVSLRYRSDDGWTVKLPVTQDASALVRDEHSFGGAEGAPPASALGLVTAYTRTRPVRPVAEINTHRRRTTLLDDHGVKLAELDDDEVVGTTMSGVTRRFRELEVELGDDAPHRLLAEVVSRLRKRGARPNPTSKISRVLGDAARAPADIPGAEELAKCATVVDLARYSILGPLRQIVLCDARVRESEDPEAIHKARVATRRLRSDLRTLRPLLARDWCASLRAELKWLGTMLGHVRDADVFLAALERTAERLPAEGRQDANLFVEHLRAARVRDRSALLDVLNSDRYRRLLEQLILAVHHPVVRAEVAEEPARSVAHRLVAKPRKRLRRQVRKLAPEPDDPSLHEVRKRAKQARYAYELMSPLLGKGAQRAARRYEAIQEVLGEHQDAVVAVAWLTDASRDTECGEEAFVAGQLAGLFLGDRDAARAAWPKTWKRARKVRAD